MQLFTTSIKKQDSRKNTSTNCWARRRTDRSSLSKSQSKANRQVRDTMTRKSLCLNRCMRGSRFRATSCKIPWTGLTNPTRGSELMRSRIPAATICPQRSTRLKGSWLRCLALCLSLDDCPSERKGWVRTWSTTSAKRTTTTSTSTSAETGFDSCKLYTCYLY